MRSIVTANDYKKIRLVSCGVKIFAKQDSGKTDTYACKWRALNDGIEYLEPFVGRDKVVHGNMAALRLLLDEAYPALNKFAKGLQEQLERQELGSCLICIAPDEQCVTLALFGSSQGFHAGPADP